MIVVHAYAFKGTLSKSVNVPRRGSETSEDGWRRGDGLERGDSWGVREWMEVWGWMGARGKAGVAMSIPASLATLSALTICLL